MALRSATRPCLRLWAFVARVGAVVGRLFRFQIEEVRVAGALRDPLHPRMRQRRFVALFRSEPRSHLRSDLGGRRPVIVLVAVGLVHRLWLLIGRVAQIHIVQIHVVQTQVVVVTLVAILSILCADKSVG